MKKSILFITTHNLASNPRLVKEAELALSMHYGVDIVCFEFNNWSKSINEQIKNKLAHASITCIAAGRQPLLPWIRSVFYETFFRLLGTIWPLTDEKLSFAVSRRSVLLGEAVKKKSKPDLIVCHYPGALWPGCKAADFFNCDVAFDMEDYHPGEGGNRQQQKITEKLFCRLLPMMSYISFAAPLFAEETEKTLGKQIKNKLTVLNYFSATEFSVSEKKSGIVKVVWFSQHITAGRGLELILPFIKKNISLVELTLVGNMDPMFKKEYLQHAANIKIAAPTQQKDLHHFLSNFDIGLSLDIPHEKNRELSITNKLLAYAQAGLYILASNTTAQAHFFNEFPHMGVCIPFNKNYSMSDNEIQKVFENIEQIRNSKKERDAFNSNNNWEKESIKLKQAWQNLAE